MNIEEKIGRMINIGFEGLEAPDYVLDWLRTGQVGGIVLFRRNIESPQQLARLIQSCRDAAPREILVSIDQEGGRVVRLHTRFTESPGAMALGCTDSEALAENVSAVIAYELRALGINWVLAPVVDLAHNPDNAVISTRALGNNSQRVRDLAVAEIRGFQGAGVAATAKHFPGHGNTPIDTHVQLAVVRGPLDFLWNHDLVPFRAAVAAGVASVMVSHVKFEALDPVYPASLSPVVTSQLLRGELAFDGLACTDCMEMNAITDHYGAGEAAVAAVLAGQDVIFYSHSPAFQQEAFDALLQAVRTKRLSEARIEESLRRIDTMIAAYPLEPRPTLEIIRSPDHLAVMKRAADAAITVLRADSSVFPLKQGHRIGLLEFSSFMDTPALESGSFSALAGLLHMEAPHIRSVSIPSRGPDETTRAQAFTLADEVDVLLVATRNAHLWPDERTLAQELIDKCEHVILLCLADPYDADALSGAGTVICTCGDSEPLLHSAVDVLMGRLQARGRLPVPVRMVS